MLHLSFVAVLPSSACLLLADKELVAMIVTAHAFIHTRLSPFVAATAEFSVKQRSSGVILAFHFNAALFPSKWLVT
jgi:hypothetical protein